MDEFWPDIGSEAAGYCFDVTKSKNGGVESICDSAGEVANSWTSLRDLDDLLSMANQRKDAGTDSWWETYQPFFFLHAQAGKEAEEERAGILKEVKELEQKKDHKEADQLRGKLMDLMVAERAPDAFQLEIKLHMDRGKETAAIRRIDSYFLKFNARSRNLNRRLREKREQKQQQQRVATEWVRRQKDLVELNRLAKKLGLQVQPPVEEDDEEEGDDCIDTTSSGAGSGRSTKKKSKGGGSGAAGKQREQQQQQNRTGNSRGGCSSGGGSNDARGKECCVVCGSTVGLKTCSRCRAVHYCSREHQLSHWKTHKAECAKADVGLAEFDINKLKCSLVIETDEPPLQMGTLLNRFESPTAKIVSCKMGMPAIFTDEELVELTPAQLAQVAANGTMRLPPTITLTSSRAAGGCKIVTTEDGRKVVNGMTYTAANGAYFTVREFVDVVAQSEAALRAKPENFFLGGINTHHVYFEGVHAICPGCYRVFWGS